MKKFDIFIWASDYEEFTGEGLLARCFVENYFFNSNLKIKILSNYGIYFYKHKIITVKKKKYTNTWITKYFSPFLGIIYIWFYYCLLYTSPSPRDRTRSRMPSSA